MKCLMVALLLCGIVSAQVAGTVAPSSQLSARALNDSIGVRLDDLQLQGSVAVAVPVTAVVPGAIVADPSQGRPAEFIAAQPQQSDQNLLKLLGTKSFMDIMQPKMMNQMDASKSLIPPLVGTNLQDTFEQQKKMREQMSGNQDAQQPQQIGNMDPRLAMGGGAYAQYTGQQAPYMQQPFAPQG